jgi:dihydrolipoamide dehydrogenase
MSDATYDVVVVGGGPGGYATALRAVAHGLRVAIVEADLVGGTCLHRGCIPSKALLHVGHLADQLPHMEKFGLASAGASLDLGAIGEFRDNIVRQLHRGLEGLLKRRQIDLFAGWGTIGEPGVVTVGPGGERITAKHIVIAPGSAPVDLPNIEADGERIIKSDEALRLERVPGSAVIIGAGAIGVELASLWRSLGSNVVLVEAAAAMVPLEDPDSSAALQRAFQRRGIDVRTGTTVASAAVAGDGVDVQLDDGSALRCDQLLVAVGRRPATSAMGLEALGVLDDRGYVVVDSVGRTKVENLWAVGDAVRTLALAHAAFAEGFVVADLIAGLPTEPLDHSLIPRVTYSTPEVASVGMTEPEARNALGDVRVTTSTFAGNARAMIEGVGGHVKLVHAPDGRLVGAHVVGPSATELIAELGLATSWEALASELGEVVHAHPSLAENVREAALAAAGLPFHAHS